MYDVRLDGKSTPPQNIVDVSERQQRATWTVPYVDLNKIQVEFANKDANDTKIDEQGNIVEDLYLVIERIEIDRFNLLEKLSKISRYIGTDGSVYHTYNHLSFNGVMTIKIHHNLLYTDWLAASV